MVDLEGILGGVRAVECENLGKAKAIGFHDTDSGLSIAGGIGAAIKHYGRSVVRDRWVFVIGMAWRCRSKQDRRAPIAAVAGDGPEIYFVGAIVAGEDDEIAAAGNSRKAI